LAPGGRVRVGRSAVRARLGAAEAPTARRIALPPGVRLGVRGSAPGDRIGLDGGGHALVRRVLAGARVPFERRADVPLVFADDRLVWIAGHRCARDALVLRGEPAVVLELEDA
ncbi:MAG: tRNA lysidine(34) synthetase TilS, partial [Thermoleophilia bacterium]|nr:tRNA lysidine(34) synthetase TilS [Thermoleophilia bacterium]